MDSSFNRIADIKRLYTEKLVTVYSPAEILIFFRQAAEKISGFSMIHLHLNDQDLLPELDIQKYKEILNRLVNREPMQYILGYTWFMDLKIEVNSSVLIPRPETEELVNGFLERIKISNPTVLDACSGSGCISLAVNHYLPDSIVFGVEISNEAIHVAKCNAEKLNLHVEYIQADILKSDLEMLPDLDAILSNPPYIPKEEIKLMDETVTKFEPEIALFVNDSKPLVFYKRLIYLGLKKLKPNGLLLMECHHKQLDAVAKLCNQEGYSSIEQHVDLSGNPRWIIACR